MTGRYAPPVRMTRRDAARLAAALALSAAAPLRGRAEALAVANPSRFDWGALRPGAEVELPDGEYDDPVIITARGTEDAPIIIRARTPLAARFTNSFVMHGARHVVLRDVLIERTRHSGVIIQEGAEAVTVTGVTVRDGGLGIWIGNGAGSGHRLIGNTLTGNKTHGVAIDAINADIDNKTLIADNILADNGYHGMEIHGSNYVVLRNTVQGSGRLLSGCSGIHTFCREAADPHGKNNIIAFNLSSGTKETTGQDGNGIQADQWCDDNLIAFNVCFDNDGAGINIYDASRTSVLNNTLYGNMRDSGGRHVYPTEISLASDFTTDMPRPQGNRILNNIAVATNPRAVAIYVEATAGSGTHEIGNNLLHHEKGAELAFWGPAQWRGTDLAQWSRLRPGPADMAGDPLFSDPATRSRDGFAPRQGSPALAAPSLGARSIDPEGGVQAWSGAAPPLGAVQAKV